MMRAVLLSGLLCAATFGQYGGAGDRQQALQSVIGGMDARLNGPLSSQQVISDSDHLAAGFNGLAPYVGGFGENDYRLNRELARAAFAWLARVSLLYASDPAVSQSLIRTYGSIGDFYHRYGTFYPSGAALAYSGGNRLARGLVLGGHGRSYERDMERFAMNWASVAYLNGALFDGPPREGEPPRDEPIAGPNMPTPDIPTTALPDVDESKLTDAQKAAWSDARDRFNSVSPKVHEARVLLAQLSARLQSQGPNISLNQKDAASALMMQGFLDDAADLIRSGQFEKASEALTRADYMRNRLKSVTGQ
ncbi:MAG TPA: hypothetical protein VMJ34_06510 [Bryobacteraceae bacterium]|nr:hypothetical protein [Bryobacteraceae bacterium]